MKSENDKREKERKVTNRMRVRLQAKNAAKSGQGGRGGRVGVMEKERWKDE